MMGVRGTSFSGADFFHDDDNDDNDDNDDDDDDVNNDDNNNDANNDNDDKRMTRFAKFCKSAKQMRHCLTWLWSWQEMPPMLPRPPPPLLKIIEKKFWAEREKNSSGFVLRVRQNSRKKKRSKVEAFEENQVTS